MAVKVLNLEILEVGRVPKKVELDTLHIFTLWKTFPDNTNLIKNT